ncbi:MAG: tetratricopeptide repeat protein [Bdellovibrionales bacterium]|nr:tetratricopeptide repeat protein [Bdellovibrionales bacterium]
MLILFLLSSVGCSETPEEKLARLKKRAAEYREQDQLEEARISLLQAMEVKADDPEVVLELAEVQLRLRQYRKALESFKAVTDLDPNNRTARLRLVSMLIAARQYEFAESELSKLLESNPQDRDGQMLKASILQGRGKLEAALKILTKLVEDDDTDAIVLAKLADVQIASGNRKDAEENLLKAVAGAPDNSTIRMGLAMLYVSQGRFEEAQELIQEVVAQEPDAAALRLYYAEFLLRRGMIEPAYEEYIVTLKTDPLRHLARDRLYDLYVLRGEKDKAFALTKELEQVPDADGAHAYFLGRDDELNGEFNAALQHYIDAIQLMRNFAPAFRRAGLTELRLGRRTEGIEHLSQTVTLDPGDVAARIALARDAFATKNYGAAAEHISHVLKRYPSQQAANVLNADILMIKGDLKQARSIYQALVKRSPNNPSGYVKLGVVDERSGDYESALSNYRKALEFDRKVLLPAQRVVAIVSQKNGPQAALDELEKYLASSTNSKPEYSMLLASLLVRERANEKNIERVKELLSFAAQERSDMAEAHALLASVLLAEGDLDSAEQGYKALVEKHPSHVPSLMILAGIRQKHSDFAAAAEYYRKVLEVSPRHPQAANNLAWILVDKLDGNLDEALRFAKIAKEEAPRDGSITDTLAWIYFLRGQPRAALGLMDEAIKLDAGSGGKAPLGPRYYRLAEIKFALNDKDGASEALTRAESSGALSPEVAKKAKVLRRRLQKGEK